MATQPGTDVPPPGQFSVVQHLFAVTKYKGVNLPSLCTPERMAKVEELEIREDDIFVTTYPKCGKLRIATAHHGIM